MMKPLELWLWLISAAAATAQTPVMTWDFETVMNGKVVELPANIADVIEGNFQQAAGVRGKGLRFDGFTTRVVREGDKCVRPGADLTVEAWVALGGYPLNWCPVITTESDEVKGWRLLIGPYGQVSFETAISEQWVACTSPNETIPLRQWMHLAAVHTAGKATTIYVNGEAVGTVPLTGTITYPAAARCMIGMAPAPGRPSDAIRTWGTLEDYHGVDGIMDEIKVHDRALTADQVKREFANHPVAAPDIPPRRLPTLPNHPGRFGAFYTNLKYYPGWDDLWPVEQDPDIVVCFEHSPVKFIFWRGLRYGPAWVAENENWMTDQSLETWAHGANDSEGCFEHMQDRHCRLSHVRIIENNDARAVVHWRYAPVSAHGHTWLPDPKTGWECWVDEYYTIYPDGAAVRKVSWIKGTTGEAVQFQESLPVTQPGQRVEELLEREYVRVGDYDGHGRTVSTDLRRQPPDWPGDYTVQQFNFKSRHKPFICFEPGNRMMVRWIGGGYNHFPVNQARCDGRWARTLDRPTHFMSSPCSDPVIHEQRSRLFWNGLYGMNDLEFTELTKVGRAWAFPAALEAGPGLVSKGYDKSQRCYQLETTAGQAGAAKITLHGSTASPVFNPAFRIKNWNGQGATVQVNGKPHPDCKIGLNRTLEGTDLIVFVRLAGEQAVNLTLIPQPLP